jgi:hypothetical protein
VVGYGRVSVQDRASKAVPRTARTALRLAVPVAGNSAHVLSAAASCKCLGRSALANERGRLPARRRRLSSHREALPTIDRAPQPAYRFPELLGTRPMAIMASMVRDRRERQHMTGPEKGSCPLHAALLSARTMTSWPATWTGASSVSQRYHKLVSAVAKAIWAVTGPTQRGNVLCAAQVAIGEGQKSQLTRSESPEGSAPCRPVHAAGRDAA